MDSTPAVTVTVDGESMTVSVDSNALQQGLSAMAEAAQGEMQQRMLQILSELMSQLDGCEKIDETAYGWKSANKRLRKATLSAEKSLKALRKASMDLER